MHPPPTTPAAPDRPALRRGLSSQSADGGVVLFDPHRVGRPVALTAFGWEAARRLDGRPLPEVRAELGRLAGGVLVPLDTVAALAAGLDDALLLDSPRFRDRVAGPVRPPACVGSYEADPAALRDQLRGLFTGAGGPGLPAPGAAPSSPAGRLRAALLPHMDYARGNVTYGWGFKELIEQTDARVFVVVATSHYSAHRFTLTRQHFETPLGVAATDRGYVDRLAEAYGPGLFDDALAHFPEHSIELEVVLLQYLLEGRRPFRIVPLLVGSFGDCVDAGTAPAAAADVGRMVAALRRAEEGCADPVCYLISGDLAHIGPKFGDRRAAAGAWLEDSRRRDDALLGHVGRADPAGYFSAVQAEGDRRRICGFPPTYLALAAARPRAGRVLHYQQYVAPDGSESVSFAAAAFYE